MPAATWKDYERRMAKMFGADRISVEGSTRADRDVDGGRNHHEAHFFYQMKKRETCQAFIEQWLAEIIATATAAGSNRVGALVLSTPGRDDSDSLVVFRAKDWRRILDILEVAGAVVEVPIGEAPPAVIKATGGTWYRLEDPTRGVQIFVKGKGARS